MDQEFLLGQPDSHNMPSTVILWTMDKSSETGRRIAYSGLDIYRWLENLEGFFGCPCGAPKSKLVSVPSSVLPPSGAASPVNYRNMIWKMQVLFEANLIVLKEEFGVFHIGEDFFRCQFSTFHNTDMSHQRPTLKDLGAFSSSLKSQRKNKQTYLNIYHVFKQNDRIWCIIYIYICCIYNIIYIEYICILYTIYSQYDVIILSLGSESPPSQHVTEASTPSKPRCFSCSGARLCRKELASPQQSLRCLDLQFSNKQMENSESSKRMSSSTSFQTLLILFYIFYVCRRWTSVRSWWPASVSLQQHPQNQQIQITKNKKHPLYPCSWRTAQSASWLSDIFSLGKGPVGTAIGKVVFLGRSVLVSIYVRSWAARRLKLKVPRAGETRVACEL